MSKSRPIIRYAPAGVIAEATRMREEAAEADAAGQHVRAHRLRRDADVLRRVALRQAAEDAGMSEERASG